MVDDVVVRQRLFDQQQVEGVELLERGEVVQRVSRVGIDLQRDRGIALANPPDHVHVPPGPDLELDAAVSLVQELIDLIEQDFDVRLDAQADAGKDLGPRATQQFVQRFFLAPCERIPASHFQAGPGEGVPLHQAIEPVSSSMVVHFRPRTIGARKSWRICQQVSVVSGQ